jgi:hypothetical protein
MPEERAAMLVRELQELRVEWPDTPDIAGAVAARLPAPAPRRPLIRWPAWQVAVAAVAALIAIVMAVPPARSAVLEWLGFASVRIERREPERPPVGAGLALGRPVSLAEARERAGFPVGVPEALGEPDTVYIAPDPAADTRVDFVYAPREGLPRAQIAGVGLLVTQFRAVAEPVIEKTAGAGTRVHRLEVGGDPAFFISGAAHGFAYTGRNVAFEPQRLAGNTLLVERRDGVLLRLEADLPRAEMVRIAASVR